MSTAPPSARKSSFLPPDFETHTVAIDMQLRRRAGKPDADVPIGLNTHSLAAICPQ
jgi:hypothetical protein